MAEYAPQKNSGLITKAAILVLYALGSVSIVVSPQAGTNCTFCNLKFG